MTTVPAQDPDELFDVVSANGEPTGISKRRADVHRDGDWHRAIHIWVYGIDDTGPYLLMNQRGRHKDTWPLALDATVGGHLTAGETLEDAYREVEEEIGIAITLAQLQFIGRRARESNGDLPGIVDREIQDVFVIRDDRPLEQFCPNPSELEGLVRLSIESALQLFAGHVSEVNAIRLQAEGRTVEDIKLHSRSLLLLPDDGYFGKVASSIMRIIRGEAHVHL